MEELYFDFNYPGSARRASGLSVCLCLFVNRMAVSEPYRKFVLVILLSEVLDVDEQCAPRFVTGGVQSGVQFCF